MSTVAPLQNLAAKSQPLTNSTHSGLLLQRKCACGLPTSSLTGECAECKSKKRLQTKLTVGASNDPLEQEADRVADQVLAAPVHHAVSGAPPRIQRYTGQVSGQADTAPASVDRVLASPGRPLNPALRQDMEQRFGHDFSRVRVHSGGAAEQSALDVNAHAYTAGHDIVFGAGRFAPGTNAGRRLIAHELTHVVQQSGADGNSVRRNNENCGGSPISQPVAEGRAVARSVQRQPAPPTEMEFPSEWVFAADVRMRTYRRYARSLGRKDAARIRKSGKLSSEDRQEVNAKLSFFESEAKAAYVKEIKPALVEVIREERQKSDEALRLLIPLTRNYATLWLTSALAAIEQAPEPDAPGDPTARNNFYIALSGNLLWAATSVFEVWNPVIIGMSFIGAAVGSGVAADEPKAPPPPGKPLLISQLTLARDRMAATAKEVAEEVAANCVLGMIDDPERQTNMLWNTIFPGIPFESSDALREQALTQLKKLLVEFRSQYDAWKSAIELEVSRRIDERGTMGVESGAQLKVIYELTLKDVRKERGPFMPDMSRLGVSTPQQSGPRQLGDLSSPSKAP